MPKWKFVKTKIANGKIILRRPFCENRDARFGFTCPSSVSIPLRQLTMSHIDGNPRNTVRHNLQTLCQYCLDWYTQLK